MNSIAYLYDNKLEFSHQGHIREAKCHIALGDPIAAIRSYERINDVNNKDRQTGVSITLRYSALIFKLKYYIIYDLA